MAKQFKKVGGKLEVREIKIKEDVSLYSMEFLNEQRTQILSDTDRTSAELIEIEELITQAINLGIES